METSSTLWVDAKEGEAHQRIVDYVETIESEQSFLYDRMYKLRCLYDPYHDKVNGGGITHTVGRGMATDSYMSENLIASNVDTVAAKIAATKVRGRFMTDGAAWSDQRKAKRLEFYVEGLANLVGLHKKARIAFKMSSLLGSGLLKICADKTTGEIVCDVVSPDEIIVDELECRNGAMPRQMHHRRLVDKTALIAAYPDNADDIDKAAGMLGARASRLWANYRPLERNQVVVVESWYRSVGKKGSAGHKPGRHVVCVPGATLHDDQEWAGDRFPFVHFVWSDREGWYGIGLAERIAGHQREQNKRHWYVGRRLDQGAAPITYVPMADANLTVATINRVGTVVPYSSGRPPETVIMPAVSGEEYARMESTRRLAFEETGVSRLAATSQKPGGLESGEALREYRDQTTERFALQEIEFEDRVLEAMLLLLAAAKDLGGASPEVIRRRYRGTEKLKLSDVDLDLAQLQIEAASTLPRTPSGRIATVQEWAAAQIITPDEARRLIDHPDLQSALSLYSAEIEDLDRSIEDMLDGEELMPEPYQNLRLGIWRITRAYLRAEADGAPDEVCERLRTWLEQASWMVAQSAPEEAAAPPGAMPGPEMAAPAL